MSRPATSDNGKAAPVTPEQETELRKLARETYDKTRAANPHMPHPDTEAGQMKLDRLYDIIAKPFRQPNVSGWCEHGYRWEAGCFYCGTD